MKEIKAYVHRSRVADVVAALKDGAIWGGTQGDRRHNLALYIVKGLVHANESADQHYSMELGDEVVNEYKLELLCEDSEADELIRAIATAARTGQHVAGWITVTELAQAVPIR